MISPPLWRGLDEGDSLRGRRFLLKAPGFSWRPTILICTSFAVVACTSLLTGKRDLGIRFNTVSNNQQSASHFAASMASRSSRSLPGPQPTNEVGRRTTLAGSFAFFGINKQAEAVGLRNKGVDVAGWQGTLTNIPNAIRNSPVTAALKTYKYPTHWPYIDSDFFRLDQTDDELFYDAPRLVAHIDGEAVTAISNFYDAVFSKAPHGEYTVLDTCSSWISHYPPSLAAKRVAITGMNEEELRRNSQATDYSVKDLNKDPTLPYADQEFDFVTNVVSIDYLTKPQEVISEIHRVTKAGGLAIFSFSNRCFITKAINLWVSTMEDGATHCRIVADYFRFSPESGWKDVMCTDVSPNPGRTDPVYIVTAVRA